MRPAKIISFHSVAFSPEMQVDLVSWPIGQLESSRGFSLRKVRALAKKIAEEENKEVEVTYLRDKQKRSITMPQYDTITIVWHSNYEDAEDMTSWFVDKAHEESVEL